MIGVVVWSNRAQQRAVIWCDNQGGLAYLKGAEQLRGGDWPEVGETVKLRCEYDAGLIFAYDVRRMESLVSP